MKLIYCTECSDVVSLRAVNRTCMCGKSSGNYIDEANAVVDGPAVVLGFSNKTFIQAVARAQTQELVYIEGRRWFSKTHGNTYHSVRIWSGNTLLKTLPYQYGYGDQYLQTAIDWLKANGYAPADAPYGTLYLREHLHMTYSIADVSRKKDL